VVTDILADPKARIPGFGEKNPLVLSHPAAVKTGTTTDWHDNWTVGYTPSFTVGVWIGNNDNHPMRQITGVTGTAPLWNQFFEEFLKGKPTEVFVRPDGITEREICAISGKLPDGICPEVTTEIFVDGTEPKEQSILHQKMKIDRRNMLRARDTCPSSVVIEKIFIDYPPEVFSWAVEHNQDVMPQQFSPLCLGDQPSDAKTYLDVTYPREGTVFETAPLLVAREAIVFEVNVSSDIKKVLWYVDDASVAEATTFPFSATWIPQKGTHIIHARGMTETGKEIRSRDVGISVVEFKGEKQ
jgi:membrane carboxypeptidase/penicillin-binding protein PbpC